MWDPRLDLDSFKYFFFLEPPEWGQTSEIYSTSLRENILSCLFHMGVLPVKVGKWCNLKNHVIKLNKDTLDPLSFKHFFDLQSNQVKCTPPPPEYINELII